MDSVRANVTKLFWANLFINFFWLSAVITFFYLQRGLNYTEILSLSAIASLAVLIFEVPTGIFADKHGRKISLLLSIVFFIFAMGIYLFAEGFALFALSSFLMGIGMAFSSGATEALLYDSLKSGSKEPKMKEVYGKYISAEVLAGIITPPIAAFIAKDLLPIQFSILIYLTLLSYIIALFLVISIKEERIVEHNRNKRQSFLDDIKLLFTNKKLIVFIFNRAFVATAMFSYMFLWQPQFMKSGIPLGIFGLLLAAGSVGVFLVIRNVGKLHALIGSRFALMLSSLLPALGFIALGFFYNPLISIILYLGIRILAAIREPLFSELINKELPSATRASLLSMIAMITAIFTLILRPVIGRLTDIDFSYGFFAIGLLCLVSAFLFPIRRHHLST